MGTTEDSAIICPACGKWYALDPEMAGKRLRCQCGGMMMAPKRVMEPGDALEEEYDVAPAATAPAKPRQTRIDANEVLARIGKMPAPPPTPEQLVEQARQHARNQRAFVENPLRDTYLPIGIIAIGLVLAFVEAMTTGKTPAKTLLEATPRVLLQTALSVGLTLGGMLLAMVMMEVCFIGSFKQSILRFIAIALGPAALYGLLTHWIGGDLGGPVIATFGSIAAYALLFWTLMQLDVKDTSVCVMLVFILVTFSHYAAYRAESLIKGSAL